MFGLEKAGLIAAIAAVLAFSGGLTNDVQAMTVTFQEGADGGGADRFSVSCSVGCEGWLFNAETLGGSIGGLIAFKSKTYAAGKGEAWEEDLLASVAGETGLVFSKTDKPSTHYSSAAIYQLFKIGNKPYNLGVLVNTAGVVQNYEFAPVGKAKGAGLSHIANYGEVLPIPLPAAGWLLLTAMGGLGVAARRRRKPA